MMAVHNFASAFAQSPESVMEKSGPASATNAQPALTLNHLVGGDCMAHEAFNAREACAQRFIDPLILQTRLVNEAEAIKRALAGRKAMRSRRSQAAAKGWETRRG